MIEVIETLWIDKCKDGTYATDIAEVRSVVEKFSLNIDQENEKKFETKTGMAIGILDWMQVQDGKLFLDYVVSEIL
jgi:hypothetical protein